MWDFKKTQTTQIPNFNTYIWHKWQECNKLIITKEVANNQEKKSELNQVVKNNMGLKGIRNYRKLGDSKRDHQIKTRAPCDIENYFDNPICRKTGLELKSCVLWSKSENKNDSFL